jgi:hypothetical protein
LRASCRIRRARRAGALLLALALALPALVGPAGLPARAAGAIVVDQAGATAAFPTSVSFTLEAHSAGSPITHAVVSYRFTGEAITRDVVATLTPAARVQVSAPLNTRSHYIPPGVDITYYWSLDDAAGDHLDTPAQRVRYEDTRYAWRVAGDTAHNLRAHWFRGGTAFGQQLVATAVSGLDRLQGQMGLTLTLPVEIWVYPDKDSFTSALPPNQPEWVGGQAMAENGVVLALIDPDTGGSFEIRRILPHELSHLVVYQTTQNPYNRPPVWLDEGLAITNQDAQEPQMATTLKNATAAGALIRLRSLQGAFPADPEAAYLSYAESASVVRFLIARYGAAKVGATLIAFRGGVTYDEALRAGIGADTDALDAAWRAWAPAALGVSPAAQTALAALPTLPAASATAGETPPAAASVTPPAAPVPPGGAGTAMSPLLVAGAACALAALLALVALAVRGRG